MTHRIKKKNIRLNEKAVLAFFEDRARKYNEAEPYTSVLYQDKNPELARQRDVFEKTTIMPKLALRSDMNVLDIGCGIGRWAETIGPMVATYTGVDISPELIAIARQRVDKDNVAFHVLGADKLCKTDILKTGSFDLVIMAGILIYLNDDAVVECLRDVAKLSASEGRVYLREPVAMEERLTLREFWSKDMEQHYSAVYRTPKQLENLFKASLYQNGFEQVKLLQMYDEPLNTRRETIQHYCIINRGVRE